MDQIRHEQEEKATLFADNQTLALQVQDLLLENSKLAQDCKLLNIAKEPWEDQVIYNTQKLATRIEELEDLIVELRQQNSTQEVLDLKTLVNAQATELSLLREKLHDAVKKRLRASELFEKNELYHSFQKIIKERDDLIRNLNEKLRDAQNAQVTNFRRAEDFTLREASRSEALENEAIKISQALHLLNSEAIQPKGLNERENWLVSD